MQIDQRRYVEFSNIVVDYADDDVVFVDHVKDIKVLYPLKPNSSIIAMCTSGSISFQFDNKTFAAHPHDVFFCPAKSRMEILATSSDFECKVVSLSDHIVQGLLHDRIHIWNHAIYMKHLCVISMSDTCLDEMKLYYSLIRSKIENHKEPPYEIMQALTRAMLLELCNYLENTQGVSDDTKMSQGKMLFNRFLRLITNSEVKRRPISEYASELAITPKYLTMLCLKYSNKTASEWIAQYTTEDIRFFLRNSNLSIKEISAKLGFANMSHFGSYVRKHLGESPTNFRHGK
jgi:AraC-like DNA-binding protein